VKQKIKRDIQHNVSVVTLSVVMPNAVLNVSNGAFKLSVVMPNVVMLGVVAPLK
jgi:hypothetical protein